MLAREWFKPEMPVKEFLLGVYEWIMDVESIREMGSRTEVIQDALDGENKDCNVTLLKAALYALVQHENGTRICAMRPQSEAHKQEWGDTGPHYPTLEKVQTWGKKMYADYLIWIANPKQAEKDLEDREKEQVEYDKANAEFEAAHPEEFLND